MFCFLFCVKKTLKQIREELLEVTLPLQESATNLVFGKGNEQADIFFIGEAPGAKEDKLGIPFVGAAGKELDKLLGSIALSLDKVYIANILKYRPPKNRNPTKEEIRTHTPFLVDQIKAVNPKVICPLGNYATKFVLGTLQGKESKEVAGISELHGKKMSITLDEKEFLVIPLFHPAAMLYNPKLRPVEKEDFKVIKEVI